MSIKALGLPVMVGASRKWFIGQLTGRPVDQRLWGSVAAAAYAGIPLTHRDCAPSTSVRTAMSGMPSGVFTTPVSEALLPIKSATRRESAIPLGFVGMDRSNSFCVPL